MKRLEESGVDRLIPHCYILHLHLSDQQYKDSNFPQSDDEEEEEGADDNFRWQTGECSDLSSPKSSSSVDEEEESGDDVEEIPSEGAGKPKKSDNSTTESYSSVLQEEEDYMDDCDNEDLLMGLRKFTHGGNPVKLSPTDSESSPTSSELLTQRFVDIYIAENGTEE